MSNTFIANGTGSALWDGGNGTGSGSTALLPQFMPAIYSVFNNAPKGSKETITISRFAARAIVQNAPVISNGGGYGSNNVNMGAWKLRPITAASGGHLRTPVAMDTSIALPSQVEMRLFPATTRGTGAYVQRLLIPGQNNPSQGTSDSFGKYGIYEDGLGAFAYGDTITQPLTLAAGQGISICSGNDINFTVPIMLDCNILFTAGGGTYLASFGLYPTADAAASLMNNTGSGVTVTILNIYVSPMVAGGQVQLNASNSSDGTDPVGNSSSASNLNFLNYSKIASTIGGSAITPTSLSGANVPANMLIMNSDPYNLVSIDKIGAFSNFDVTTLVGKVGAGAVSSGMQNFYYGTNSFNRRYPVSAMSSGCVNGNGQNTGEGFNAQGATGVSAYGTFGLHPKCFAGEEAYIGNTDKALVLNPQEGFALGCFVTGGGQTPVYYWEVEMIHTIGTVSIGNPKIFSTPIIRATNV